MAQRLFVFISLITFAVSAPSPGNPSAAGNLSDLVCEVHRTCDCPGSELICRCTTINTERIIVWNGSVFNSSSNRCTRLVSSQDGRPDRCGPFYAHVLSTHESNFTSQLDLPVLPEYNGRTIWCNTIKDGESMIIGTYTINYASVALPSPQDIGLIDLNPSELVFGWTHVLGHHCSNITYITHASNTCGECTSNTTLPNATCTLFNATESGNVCNFTVQAVVCGEHPGLMGTPVKVILKLPRKPADCNVTFTIEPNSKKRREISVTFTNEDNFTIYDGFDGSVLYYCVTLRDHASGSNCSSINISAPSCSTSTCSHTFNVLHSPCALSTKVSVTVYGCNILGKGATLLFIKDLSMESDGVRVGTITADGRSSIGVLIAIIILLLVSFAIFAVCYWFVRPNKQSILEWLIYHRLRSRHINESNLKEVETSITLIYDTVANDASKIKTFMAEKLPFYDHSWGYGYYELTGERDLSCSVNVLLKLSNDVYKTTILRHLFDHTLHGSHVTISSNQIKTDLSLEGIYIQSRSEDDLLAANQGVIFFAPLKEIKGHNECHQVPDQAEGDLRLAVYAQQTSPFCRQGFGYYEYKKGSQLTKNKKSVILEIEGKFYTGLGTRCLRSSTPSNGELYCKNSDSWTRMFVHSSGVARTLERGQHFLFSISMDVIANSYCVRVKAEDGYQNMSGVYKRMKIHCYQLLCGYYQLGCEERCVKDYTHVILRDKDGVLYTGENVHRFLGKTKVTEKMSLPDLSGTKFSDSEVFIQSNEIDVNLQSGTYFLYCAPLYEVDAFFSTFPVQGKPRLVNFARKKIPGFDVSKGFGYYRFTGLFDELCQMFGYKGDTPPPQDYITSPKLILLGRTGHECKLYIGPGSYHCALDIIKDKQLNPDRVNSTMQEFERWIVFIQSTSFEHTLENGTEFLYCEHRWV